jgi:hypothetical protein
LAGACIDKGTVLQALKDLHNAVKLCERARTIHEGLVEREGRSEFASDLPTACMNEAIVKRELGNGRDAVGLYDRAIAIYQDLP